MLCVYLLDTILYNIYLTPTERKNESPIRQLRKFSRPPKLSEVSTKFHYLRGRTKVLKYFRKFENFPKIV